MCGIVGALVFKSNSYKITEPYIKKMRDVLVHRGPDDKGLWISKNGKTGLGHRRLSIIDLSKIASQPMSNEDNTIWISFNGEIYNHAEVRAELERIGGHIWKTDHSDTEVILHAFEQWGIDCLHKFRGMFAIALWDDRNKELWLVRDRIGIKPLYYSFHHGRITFASEIKALLQDHEQKRVVNEEAFYHYLTFSTTPAPQTLFQDIEKLPGGTWMRIKEDGQTRLHRYWDVLDHTIPMTNINEQDIAEMVLSELRKSVHLRKVSDVPMGIFLSGGIDSSANAALFSEDQANPIKTFSIGYDREYDSYKNEFDYARIMAEYINADYHEKKLTVDHFIAMLPKLMFHLDEPNADAVCVPTYYLSKLARDNGIVVCQVGEGSDELFYGYPHWKTFSRYQKLSNLPMAGLLTKIGVSLLKKMDKEHKTKYEWLRRAASREHLFWSSWQAFTEGEKKRLLSNRLKDTFQNYSSYEAIKPIINRFNDRCENMTPLKFMSYMDLNFQLPELLLSRVDKMTMSVSLEARVPFLDHKFVELAMSIPDHFKIKDGIEKYILKRSVRGLMPNELIDRKKQGFNVPMHEWFLDRLGDFASKKIFDFTKRTDLFSSDYINELLTTKKRTRLWFILNIVLWHERWIEGKEDC